MNKKQRLILVGLLLGLSLGGLFFLLKAQHPQVTQTKNTRIITTTTAMTQVFSALDIPLVGVPTANKLSELPVKMRKLPKVGNHIAVNFEKIVALKPSVVYVDQALTDDYRTKLQAQHIKMVTLDFTNYGTLKQSITQLGQQYQRVAKAQALISHIKLKSVNVSKKPKVLILMGMPGGGFLTMNAHSYIGDLVTRAGGQVVGANQQSLYGTPSTEKIVKANPDIIIRLAHAMPSEVKANFNATFAKAPYANLQAVKNKHVYDVTAPVFSPTANLKVKQAYQQIKEWLAQVE